MRRAYTITSLCCERPFGYFDTWRATASEVLLPPVGLMHFAAAARPKLNQTFPSAAFLWVRWDVRPLSSRKAHGSLSAGQQRPGSQQEAQDAGSNALHRALGDLQDTRYSSRGHRMRLRRYRRFPRENMNERDFAPRSAAQIQAPRRDQSLGCLYADHLGLSSRRRLRPMAWHTLTAAPTAA